MILLFLNIVFRYDLELCQRVRVFLELRKPFCDHIFTSCCGMDDYLDVNATKQGCQVFLLKLGMETSASAVNSVFPVLRINLL